MAYWEFGKDRKYDQRVKHALRETISDAVGFEAFYFILMELGLFDTVEDMTDYERGRHDYAKRLIEILGIDSDQLYRQAIKAMIEIGGG